MELHEFCDVNNIDFLSLQETGIQDKSFLVPSSVAMGYRAIWNSSLENQNASVGLLFRSNFRVSKEWRSQTGRIIGVTVILGNQKWLILSIYFPTNIANASRESDDRRIAETMMEELADWRKFHDFTVIAGDFNDVRKSAERVNITKTGNIVTSKESSSKFGSILQYFSDFNDCHDAEHFYTSRSKNGFTTTLAALDRILVDSNCGTVPGSVQVMADCPTNSRHWPLCWKITCPVILKRRYTKPEECWVQKRFEIVSDRQSLLSFHESTSEQFSKLLSDIRGEDWTRESSEMYTTIFQDLVYRSSKQYLKKNKTSATEIHVAVRPQSIAQSAEDYQIYNVPRVQFPCWRTQHPGLYCCKSSVSRTHQ